MGTRELCFCSSAFSVKGKKSRVLSSVDESSPLLFLFFTLRTPEFEMALLASAVDAFRASGVTPATTAAVLFATRGLLDQGSESADAAGEASSADASSTEPSVAIASLVRALGEDLTSTDDTRRAGSTQLLSEVCEEGGA